jgi:outer membrane protein OmpA-like peptidoglycan-associated protein
MNNVTHTLVRPNSLVAMAVAALLLGACATAPLKPAGAADARARLTRLESNPDLATRAPEAMREAEAAVTLAEIPQTDPEVGRSNVYLADRTVDIAVARAKTKLLEDQRTALAQQREEARLNARTREADIANASAANSRAEAGAANLDAANSRAAAGAANTDAANSRAQAGVANAAAANSQAEAGAANLDAANSRAAAGAANADAANSRAQAGVANAAAANSQAEAGAANLDAANSRANAAELQHQLDDLHGRSTDHGTVITLGDVMFGSAQARLRSAVVPNLDRLAVFLNHYPDRSIVIDGYTDNVGAADYNLGLSQRRANTVKAYLMNGGVNSARITATGMGASDPVATNDSSDGRQQNRRVEVTISDPAAAAR